MKYNPVVREVTNRAPDFIVLTSWVIGTGYLKYRYKTQYVLARIRFTNSVVKISREAKSCTISLTTKREHPMDCGLPVYLKRIVPVTTSKDETRMENAMIPAIILRTNLLLANSLYLLGFNTAVIRYIQMVDKNRDRLKNMVTCVIPRTSHPARLISVHSTIPSIRATSVSSKQMR